MEIQAHLVTGNVLTFDVKTEKPEELLKQLKPRELFKRPVHQFLGSLRTVTINPRLVEWIEAESETTPKNAGLAGAPVVRQLSSAQFAEKVNVGRNALISAMENKAFQNVLLAYGIATFQSGHTLFMEVQSRPGSATERASASLKMFDSPAIVAARDGGGILIINTANIQIWQVIPGLKKSASFTLQAELKSIKSKKI